MIGFDRKSLILSSVVGVVTLAACSPDNTPSNVPKGPFTEVHFINASPTVASADAYLATSRGAALGTKMISALASGASDTGYISYGSRFIQYTAAGNTTIIGVDGTALALPLFNYVAILYDSLTGMHEVQF